MLDDDPVCLSIFYSLDHLSGQPASQDSCNETAEIESRSIPQDGLDPYKKGGGQKLPQIVENPPKGTDRQYGQAFFRKTQGKRHGKKTQKAAGSAVEQAEQASKSKCIQKIAEHGKPQGIAGIFLIEHDQYHQICQPQFHARKREGQRDQAFQIAEDKSKCCVEGKLTQKFYVAHGAPPVTASGGDVSLSPLLISNTSLWGRHTMVSPDREIRLMLTQTLSGQSAAAMDTAPS